MEVRLPKELIVKGSAEKLYRAFSNILDNAVKYNVDGGRVEVIGDQSGADLTITVSNTGPGVAELKFTRCLISFTGSKNPGRCAMAAPVWGLPS
jgi:signal transduction histidine kinase